MTDLVAHILATWRLSSLLYAEDGPYGVFAYIRDKAGVRYGERGEHIAISMPAKMLSCFLCTSVWAAAIVGLFKFKLNPIDWLAWSAGAILVRKWTKTPRG